MQLPVTDVEGLKKKVRKLTAGRVLAGQNASVYLEMGALRGCKALVAAGFGSLTRQPEAVAYDRLLYIVDGRVEVIDAGDESTTISQGESTVLPAGKPFRLYFPHVTIYLQIEPSAE